MVDRVRRRDPRAARAPHRRRAPGCACCRCWRRSAPAWPRAAAGRPSRPYRSAVAEYRLDERHHLAAAPRCWSPAAPGPSARRSSTSCWTPASAEVRILDNLVRGRRANLRDGPGRPPGRSWSSATSATVDLVHDLTKGTDLVFHQAAIRITQCAEEPRLALEVLVDGTFNVLEAAAAAQGRQGRRRVVGLGLRPGRAVPDHRAPPPPQQRHLLRRGQVVQRGHAAQLPGDVRAGLRRAALLQRLRPADGHPRPLHRGADPLDGAHRRRPAAADLRRRPADDGLRLHRRHRPRATCSPRAVDITEGVYNVASGVETSLLDWPRRCSRRWTPTCASSTARSAPVNGVTRRLADTEAAAATSGSRAEIGLEDGPARAGRLVAGRAAAIGRGEPEPAGARA